jgi:hypothetical protein
LSVTILIANIWVCVCVRGLKAVCSSSQLSSISILSLFSRILECSFITTGARHLAL